MSKKQEDKNYINLLNTDDVGYLNVNDVLNEANEEDYVNSAVFKLKNSASKSEENDTGNYLHPVMTSQSDYVEITEEPNVQTRKHPEIRKTKAEEDPDYINISEGLAEQIFHVFVKPFNCLKTPPSFGHCTLAVSDTDIQLRSTDNQTVFLTWPIKFIRRYGWSKTSFYIEAGRFCESGPGLFAFVTDQGREICDVLKQQL